MKTGEASGLKAAWRAVFRVLPALCAAVWLAGCDDITDDDFDYVPAAGYGALIVDNNSPTDVNVYVDGASVGRVGDNDDKAYDLTPGVHRIVLDEDDGSRQWGGDVDILEGRQTILRVTLDGSGYRVNEEFD